MSSHPQIQDPTLFILTQKLISPERKEKNSLVKSWCSALQNQDPLALFTLRGMDHRSDQDKHRLRKINLSSFSLAMIAWDWEFLAEQIHALIEKADLGASPNFLHEFPWFYDSTPFAEGKADDGWTEIKHWEGRCDYFFPNQFSGTTNQKDTIPPHLTQFAYQQSLSVWEMLLRRDWEAYQNNQEGYEERNQAFVQILDALIQKGIHPNGLSKAIEGYIGYQYEQSRNSLTLNNSHSLVSVLADSLQNKPIYLNAMVEALETIRLKVNDYFWGELGGQVFYESLKFNQVIPKSTQIKKPHHL